MKIIFNICVTCGVQQRIVNKAFKMGINDLRKRFFPYLSDFFLTVNNTFDSNYLYNTSFHRISITYPRSITSNTDASLLFQWIFSQHFLNQPLSINSLNDGNFFAEFNQAQPSKCRAISNRWWTRCEDTIVPASSALRPGQGTSSSRSLF